MPKAYSFERLAANADRRLLYLFGSGMGGQCAAAELRARGVRNIAGFLDNAPERKGSECGGLPIRDPDDPSWRRGNPLAILSPIDSRYIIAMRRQCESLGVEHISYSELTANSYGWETPDWWGDAESRQTFQAILRLFRDHDWSALPPPTPDQYFQSFVPDRLYRSFVDGGAYVGDTLGVFRHRFGDDFDAYYAFEPNPRNFAALERQPRDPRVRLFQIGLAGREADLFITPGVVASGARVVAEEVNGAGALRVNALDNVLANQAVSFIKLDVEGAELDALKGARGIIETQRPALAVCVYHRPDHLWEIPRWIKEVGAGYRLYLRHHSDHDYETVCYAVPGVERSNPS